MSDDDRTPAEENPPTEALPAQTAPTSALVVERTDAVEPVPSAPVATPTTPPEEPEPRMPRGIRMRTVVLGLVLLAISATSLLRVLTDVRIDDSLVLLILLVVAGALLLGAGVASAAREARSGRSRD
jgi:hypothetical protein